MRQNPLDKAIQSFEAEIQALARAVAILKAQRGATVVKRMAPKLVIERRPS